MKPEKYMKPDGKDDHILAVYPAVGNEWVSLLTKKTRALCFPIDQITLVRGAGKGVYAIKLERNDFVAAFELCSEKNGGII